MKPWSTALAPTLQVQHQPLGLLWKATTLEIFPKAPTNSIAQTHFYGRYHKPTVQFSSVAQSYPTLCDPVNHSTPGLPVHHQLPEFTQTHKPTVTDKYMVLTATKDPGYAMSKVFVFLYFISACSLVESESD